MLYVMLKIRAIICRAIIKNVSLIVFLMSCYCLCSVALPHGTWVGLQCVIVVKLYFLIILSCFFLNIMWTCYIVVMYILFFRTNINQT